MALILNTEKDTEYLGKLLAANIAVSAPMPIFMYGDLGSGKTTLTRYIVQNLGNSEGCEISSPSFTVCNLYPCTPQVLHCDLYRCRKAIPDEIYEALDDTQTLVIMEWAEYFPSHELPQNYLELSFRKDGQSRLVEIRGHGAQACKLSAIVQASFPKQQTSA